MASPSCYTIGPETTLMKDFVGYPMFVDTQNQVKDTTTLDSYLLTQLDNNTEYMINFKAAYDCPMWDGGDQRFHMSYYQGLLTFLAQNSKSVTPCTSTSANTNRFVCASTCTMARAALANIFSNATSCNQNPTAAVAAQRQSTLATYDKNCNLWPTGANCIPVVAIEANQAGFPLLRDAQNFCASNSDPLCNMLGASGGMGDKTITRNLLIAGIVLAVFVTISMAGVVFYCFRNSGPGDSNGKFVDLDKQAYGGAIDMDSHKEPHFEGAEIIRDVVVGLSDGLTVPFALTAGLASLGNSKFVVLAGVSELVAGAISMGLGGYLGGKSEIEHYNAEEAREWQEVMAVPDVEEQEIVDIFAPYGMTRQDLEPLLANLRNNPELWVEFMMTHELAMEKPESSRLWISALTVGGSYFMGGLVPLIPYMLVSNSNHALFVSIGATLLVLFVFGFVKAKLIGVPNVLQSAVEMLFVGAGAAGAAFGVAKLLPSPEM
ncbi:VIT family-domain-containing protein, partial [Chytriomyces sp. MP71]